MARAGFAVVVMGVSGSGKSTVGAALAARLGCGFVEGDALHPPENVERMRAGLALDDARRAPWLAKVAAALDAAVRRDEAAVASCSALKRRYRDALRAGVEAPLLFLWLDAGRDALARRIAGREGHYMPVGLLDSQLETLEPPDPDERSLRVGTEADPQAAVAEAMAWIAAARPQSARS